MNQVTLSIGNNESYLNLIAAIFEQTMNDWINAWKFKYDRLGDYSNEDYENDGNCIRKYKRDSNEYKKIKRRLDLYTKFLRDTGSVITFLNNKWFESICVGCELDSNSVRDEFEKVKNNIINELR